MKQKEITLPCFVLTWSRIFYIFFLQNKTEMNGKKKVSKIDRKKKREMNYISKTWKEKE